MTERRLMTSQRYGVLFTGLLVAAMLLLACAFYPEIPRLQRWGYLGLAIMAFMGGATVVLVPVPSLAFTFAMGAALDPWTVGLIASTAETLGTLSGFLVGASARGALQNGHRVRVFGNRPIVRRVRQWTERYGLWAVFGFSAIPNPFLDIVGVTTGALRLRPWKFTLACWLGKTIKTLAVAWAGAGMLPLAAKLFVR